MMWYNNKSYITIFAVSLLLAYVAAQDLTCISCYDADNCLKNLEATDIKTCEAKTCYTQINANLTISRGCLEDGKETECQAPSCVSCSGTDKCNNLNVCKSCSSDDDPKCAQTDASTANNAICDKADSKCMISVLEKKTERGCVTDEIEKTCTDEKTCQMCTGGACNLGIFPQERRTCFQCNDTIAACADAQASGAALPCTQYVENDTCYMYGSDETHLTRGCTSDVGEQNKCATNDEKCKTCNSNACNSLGYKTEQLLECIQCSDKDGCAWGHEASTAKSCEQKILYSAEGKCYTRTDGSGTVTRGCFYDLDDADQRACETGTNCTTCTNANGCNNVDTQNFTCIRCRSDENDSCRHKPKEIGGQNCRSLVQSNADMKCFTGVWRTNLLIRGCLIDLEDRDQFICNDPYNDNCVVCDSSNCNNKTNGAAYFFLTNGLLSAVLFTLWRMK
ncbi:uncharacterized protein [Bactrocera oleae]|uniref:uncharacterized protein n=1 Tax=Bactrocera oleae TaxID=104688 RepID=UPI00387EC316